MKRSKQFPLIAFCCGLLSLTGCVSQKETMIQQGYPLAYADGFDDGCHSGKKAGGSLFDQFRKDAERFQIDSQYSQGWSDGFRQCESEQEALQRQVRMAMEQQHYKEEKKHYEREEQHHLEKEMFKNIDTSGLENLK